ncbi:DUF1318 domain-containing protein [Candidatus Sumerlaeota bacterium]|nr:DUF1318 domain-containing protein [Candidatus Sumerlaeota bacterium]MBI3735628.1 DUF1318 domain-containing protein [Candidatus Sumerlaeota bacterium]
MNSTKSKIAIIAAGMAVMAGIPMGCPTWRTEHKIETTHKIEAHIVLDIRRIQEDAAQVEGEVRQTPKAQPDGAKPQSSFLNRNTGREVASRSLLSLFDVSSSAQAANASDKDAAVARRKERFPQLDKALTQGCVGENNKGMIELRSCDAAKDADEKKKLDQLVKDENADRKTIYSVIAEQQGAKAEHYEAVGVVYAAEICKNLKKGQPFQVPSDDKLFEGFKATPLGKSLPDAKKGEWVKVP